MNEGLTGLERYEGEKFNFLIFLRWTIPLNVGMW